LWLRLCLTPFDVKGKMISNQPANVFSNLVSGIPKKMECIDTRIPWIRYPEKIGNPGAHVVYSQLIICVHFMHPKGMCSALPTKLVTVWSSVLICISSKCPPRGVQICTLWLHVASALITNCNAWPKHWWKDQSCRLVLHEMKSSYENNLSHLLRPWSGGRFIDNVMRILCT